MTLIDAFLNAYINANILLVGAVILWMVAWSLMRLAGLRHAFGTQLRLINSLFFAVALSPFIAAGFQYGISAGVIGNRYVPNLSDFAVAQYLDGRIEMKATAFADIIGFRDRLTHDLVTLKTPLGITAALFLLGGFSVLTLRVLASAIQLRNLIRRSYKWRQFGNVQLRLSDTVSVPFSTRSPWHRFIVIPTKMLENSDDLRMALAHEFQHIRQGDVEWEIGLETLKPLFFWNPAFLIWKRSIGHLRELACDQTILARHKFDAKSYCDCLLRVCQDGIRSRSHRFIPNVAFVRVDRDPFSSNSARFLLFRVTSMLQATLPRDGRKLFRLVQVPLVAALVFGTIAIQRPGDWSQDRLMLSTIVNLERLEARNAPRP
jgi:beta-lactamase regulating signal transducer with metallopeptidase domain